jgi:hypothetical protein
MLARKIANLASLRQAGVARRSLGMRLGLFLLGAARGTLTSPRWVGSIWPKVPVQFPSVGTGAVCR